MSASFNGQQLFSITQEGGKRIVRSVMDVCLRVWDRECLFDVVFTQLKAVFCVVFRQSYPPLQITHMLTWGTACMFIVHKFVCMYLRRHVGVMHLYTFSGCTVNHCLSGTRICAQIDATTHKHTKIQDINIQQISHNIYIHPNVTQFRHVHSHVIHMTTLFLFIRSGIVSVLRPHSRVQQILV